MPAHTLTPSVVLDRVTFTWPDGSSALDGRLRRVRRRSHRPRRPQRLRQVHAAAPDRRRARPPPRGTSRRRRMSRTCPQRLTLDVDRPRRRAARRRPRRSAPLRAIESGDVDPRHFDAVGDDWDIEARAARRARRGRARARHARPPRRRAVGRRGGAHRDRRHPAARGSRSRCSTSRPTTSTATRARGSREMVRGWRGTLIVVSHDVALLELMDDTAELYDERAVACSAARTRSGGRGWTPSRTPRGRPRRAAAQVVRREKRDRIEAETKIARAPGDGAQGAGREARAADRRAATCKRAAQVSAGKLRTEARDKESARAVGARRRRAPGARRRRGAHRPARSRTCRQAAASRRSATASGRGSIQGPERVALIGANGVGKTTLLERLVGVAAQTVPTRPDRPREPQRIRDDGERPARRVLTNGARRCSTPTASATCRSGSTGWTSTARCSRTCAAAASDVPDARAAQPARAVPHPRDAVDAAGRDAVGRRAIPRRAGAAAARRPAAAAARARRADEQPRPRHGRPARRGPRRLPRARCSS